MIRGTTPTIFFTLHTVDPNDIVIAYLTIKQKTKVLEKDIDSMTVGEGRISWDLTQAETLSFDKGSCIIEARYKTASGKAYVTKKKEEGVEDIEKDGEI